MSGVIRSVDRSGRELARLLEKYISTYKIEIYGRIRLRNIDTIFLLGRARVRDNLDIGDRASVIFGTSEMVQGWIDLRFRWSSSFPLEQQVLFGESPTFVYEYSNIVNKKIS